MKIGETKRVTKSHCTNCGKTLSGAAGLDNDCMPEPGDATVCLYCGHLMCFADDLSMRELTDEEIIEWAGHPEIVAFNKMRAKIFSGDPT